MAATLQVYDGLVFGRVYLDLQTTGPETEDVPYHFF